MFIFRHSFMYRRFSVAVFRGLFASSSFSFFYISVHFIAFCQDIAVYVDLGFTVMILF